MRLLHMHRISEARFGNSSLLLLQIFMQRIEIQIICNPFCVCQKYQLKFETITERCKFHSIVKEICRVHFLMFISTFPFRLIRFHCSCMGMAKLRGTRPSSFRFRKIEGDFFNSGTLCFYCEMSLQMKKNDIQQEVFLPYISFLRSQWIENQLICCMYYENRGRFFSSISIDASA